ncbi:hypothetical protein MTR_3g014295 [Medicago truncatula]|uniref:Uncharacterized protein n=1 Tax=Medicago truncatula TaxID=3880 RepID=A0A072UUH0_MEDTR|nr:hypothetical protein MTR_3g014295 [Medicago truncatula]
MTHALEGWEYTHKVMTESDRIFILRPCQEKESNFNVFEIIRLVTPVRKKTNTGSLSTEAWKFLEHHLDLQGKSLDESTSR